MQSHFAGIPFRAAKWASSLPHLSATENRVAGIMGDSARDKAKALTESGSDEKM